MTQAIAYVAIIVAMLIVAVLLAGSLRILRAGVEATDQFERAGFGARAFWRGGVRRQGASSSIATHEGFSIVASKGTAAVKQTRTVTRELF